MPLYRSGLATSKGGACTQKGRIASEIPGARNPEPRVPSACGWSSRVENPPAPVLSQWSGREDLNLRPPAPKAGALPGCATPRLHRQASSLYLRASLAYQHAGTPKPTLKYRHAGIRSPLLQPGRKYNKPRRPPHRVYSREIRSNTSLGASRGFEPATGTRIGTPPGS